ncbi:MAG: phosphopentomutase [Rubrobacteraceae bacterium]
MSRVLILVLDALGVGAMDDVPESRPRDVGANTLLHVLRWREQSQTDTRPLSNLARLGLGRLLAHLALEDGEGRGLGAIALRSALGYSGADSYVAHQTMMGTDMTGLRLGSFSRSESTIVKALEGAGHEVRRALSGMPVLLVDGCMVVGDNLEADPGLNYNVTGSLDLTSFEHIAEVAKVVRGVVFVSRVIAVGGTGLDAGELVSHLREGIGGVHGIDTPATGFYDRDGLQVRHMGSELDRSRQLPTLAVRAGLPVSLIGKMSDVVDCPEANHLPGVQSEEVLETTLRVMGEQAGGLIAANVQEMDLAGHRQDVARWAERLELADRGLGEILNLLDSEDILMVLGDHGNDPIIGHEFHTREYVPILAAADASGEIAVEHGLRERGTLADVGATAAAILGLPDELLETGEPIGELSSIGRGGSRASATVKVRREGTIE